MEATNEELANEDIDHKTDIVKRVYEMTSESKHCDAVLVINDVRYDANSIILATCGEYYAIALKNNVKEFTFNYEGNIDSVIVSNFFKLIHAGTLDIKTANLVDTISLAKFLNANTSLNYCFTHYVNNLTVDSALFCYFLMQKYSKEDVLTKKCKEFISTQFLKVLDTEYFPKLDINTLSQILSSDDLSVKYEKQVFEAVKLWLNSNEKSENTCSLFLSVRYMYIAPEYFIKEVMPLLDHCEICSDILKNYVEWNMNPKGRKSSTGLNLYKPLRNKTLTLMIVGKVKEKNNCIYTYDLDTKKIKLFMDFDHLIDHKFCTIIHNELIIIGEKSVEKPHQSWKINLQSKEITVLDIIMPDNGYAAVAMEEYLYICGGVSSEGETNIVEKWNLLDQTKHPVKSMNLKRSQFKVIAYNNKLYVIGGTYNASMNSTEIYDPKTDKWTLITSTTYIISLESIATLGQYIYVSFNSNIGRFNIDNNKWESINSNPKHLFNPTLIGRNINFLGETVTLSDVRRDPKYGLSDEIWEEFLIESNVSQESQIFIVPSFHDDFF